ncbi:unnamed protein product [Haemonchus placei]|uniref:WAPL domain-containing protein n=1 Tax=Haemonchus placei TaxID=6290 RepID=A0A0N4WFB2_HAEPC|nr:unnamed protein product [Haemonchus placei]
MSKRTFIPKWNPYPKSRPISVKNRGRPRDDEIRSRRQAPVETKDSGEIRWFGDPSQTKPPPRITGGRVTQRVGLFRNAKQSQIVVNEISSAVRKKTNKQIGRLVAPDKDVPCSNGTYADDSAFDVPYGPNDGFRETRCNSHNDDVDDHGRVRQKKKEKSPNRLSCDNDYGFRQNSKRKVKSVANKHLHDEIAWKHDYNAARAPSKSSKWRVRAEPNDSSDVDELNSSYEAARSPVLGVKLHPFSFDIEPRNMPSLSGVAARVLSALPTLYLRDDHHETYDSLALRLVGECIKNRESNQGTAPNVFRSFLDSTSRIVAEENSSQPDDDGCEDIFRDDSPTEKLFNQTVAEWNADKSLASPLRTNKNATYASSMMTPSSMNSSINHLGGPPFSFDEKWEFSPPATEQDNFPFSRDSSRASSHSSDESVDVDVNETFEWTIPPAKSDIFDLINDK